MRTRHACSIAIALALICTFAVAASRRHKSRPAQSLFEPNEMTVGPHPVNPHDGPFRDIGSNASASWAGIDFDLAVVDSVTAEPVFDGVQRIKITHGQFRPQIGLGGVDGPDKNRPGLYVQVYYPERGQLVRKVDDLFHILRGGSHDQPMYPPYTLEFLSPPIPKLPEKGAKIRFTLLAGASGGCQRTCRVTSSKLL
ncbi:hypothetical protein ABH944_009099 [Caballeronia udeis]|uniref:Uncharacterized protein n=1 Tax=Caballeronia udeis TaxID=1232866 RepID=A0ABW8N306_9BURK